MVRPNDLQQARYRVAWHIGSVGGARMSDAVSYAMPIVLTASCSAQVIYSDMHLRRSGSGPTFSGTVVKEPEQGKLDIYFCGFECQDSGTNEVVGTSCSRAIQKLNRSCRLGLGELVESVACRGG